MLNYLLGLITGLLIKYSNEIFNYLKKKWKKYYEYLGKKVDLKNKENKKLNYIENKIYTKYRKRIDKDIAFYTLKI